MASSSKSGGKYTKEEVEEAFHAMDIDGNGFISASDLRAFYRALGENLTDEELDDLIAGLDLDGDGQVAMDEFSRLAQKGSG